MSRFATPAQGAFAGLQAGTWRAKFGLHAPSVEGVEGVEGVHPSLGYRRSRLNGGRGGESFDFGVTARIWYVNPMTATGGQQAKRIIGTTRDSANATMANCIVQGFRTTDDLYVGAITSDNAGYFELPTQYTEAHYLVAYKAGSPDVAGTTVNTLVGV